VNAVKNVGCFRVLGLAWIYGIMIYATDSVWRIDIQISFIYNEGWLLCLQLHIRDQGYSGQLRLCSGPGNTTECLVQNLIEMFSRVQRNIDEYAPPSGLTQFTITSMVQWESILKEVNNYQWASHRCKTILPIQTRHQTAHKNHEN